MRFKDEAVKYNARLSRARPIPDILKLKDHRLAFVREHDLLLLSRIEVGEAMQAQVLRGKRRSGRLQAILYTPLHQRENLVSPSPNVEI